MGQKLFFVLSICLFLILIQPNATHAEHNRIDYNLLSDTLVTLLNPHIAEAVEHTDGYNKSYGLYDIEMLSISIAEEEGVRFRVKTQVDTVEAAHNPPYGKETIIFEVAIDKVEVIEFIHEGNEKERKIKHFYDEAISDIRKTFKLNLNSFKELTYKQLLYESE